MSSTKRRSVTESAFDRNQRRETEIKDALKQEAARHAAIVKNMYRLRALRVARNAKSSPNKGWLIAYSDARAVHGEVVQLGSWRNSDLACWCSREHTVILSSQVMARLAAPGLRLHYPLLF
jgi:hypothetical protein